MPVRIGCSVLGTSSVSMDDTQPLQGEGLTTTGRAPVESNTHLSQLDRCLVMLAAEQVHGAETEVRLGVPAVLTDVGEDPWCL